LVSGFNIGKGLVVSLYFFFGCICQYFIFKIIILCYFLDVIWIFSYIILGFHLIPINLFIWVRGTLPRFRYDKLIYFWKRFLPFSLNLFRGESCDIT
jgi:NADH-ubiquinone oxidoreductase chain 1